MCVAKPSLGGRSRGSLTFPARCRSATAPRPAQRGSGEHVLQPHRQPPAPIGVRVGGAGQVGLLVLAGDVFELHQHQPRPRARQIGEDRVAELAA